MSNLKTEPDGKAEELKEKELNEYYARATAIGQHFASTLGLAGRPAHFVGIVGSQMIYESLACVSKADKAAAEWAVREFKHGFLNMLEALELEDGEKSDAKAQANG